MKQITELDVAPNSSDCVDQYLNTPIYIYGRGSSVGIATDYGLDGPGSNPGGGGARNSAPPDRPWGPPSLL